MKPMQDSGLFSAAPSRPEAKGDATTRVARQIVDLEAAARIAKTERLRAARLAQETDASAVVPKKPAGKRLTGKA